MSNTPAEAPKKVPGTLVDPWTWLRRPVSSPEAAQIVARTR